MSQKTIIVCDSCGAEICSPEQFSLKGVPVMSEIGSVEHKSVDFCTVCWKKLAEIMTAICTKDNLAKTFTAKQFLYSLSVIIRQCGDIPIIATSVLEASTTPSKDGLYTPNIYVTEDPILKEPSAIIKMSNLIHRKKAEDDRKTSKGEEET